MLRTGADVGPIDSKGEGYERDNGAVGSRGNCGKGDFFGSAHAPKPEFLLSNKSVGTEPDWRSSKQPTVYDLALFHGRWSVGRYLLGSLLQLSKSAKFSAIGISAN